MSPRSFPWLPEAKAGVTQMGQAVACALGQLDPCKYIIFLSLVSSSCYKSVNLSILLSKQTLSVKTLFWAAPRAHTSCSPLRNIHSNGGTRLGVLQGEVASARLGWQEEVGLLGWAGAKSTFHPSGECPASLWFCQPPLMSMSVQPEAVPSPWQSPCWTGGGDQRRDWRRGG